MRASWGEVKWLDVRPVVVPWLPDVGTVVVYLFRERVTDAAQPLGDLVVVVQDDEADPPALTEVTDVQPLTPRELEVLRLMALGWETEYIAAELEVTLHTVRSHVANLRRKLNAKSRFEAVMTATRLGILSLSDRCRASLVEMPLSIRLSIGPICTLTYIISVHVRGFLVCSVDSSAVHWIPFARVRHHSCVRYNCGNCSALSMLPRCDQR